MAEGGGANGAEGVVFFGLGAEAVGGDGGAAEVSGYGEGFLECD